jgi:hypothetical protein
MPLEGLSDHPGAEVVARSLQHALSQNLRYNQHFTMVESGHGSIHVDRHYEEPAGLLLRLMRHANPANGYRHCYLTGSVSLDADDYVAQLTLIDAGSGKSLAAKSVRIFNEDLERTDKKKSPSSRDSIMDGISLDLTDSYLQGPMNILAWLNDIYVRISYIPFLNVKLGITNFYLEMNDDISLFSTVTYPHFMSGPVDGFNNFDPLVYAQFTQLSIRKCVPYLGVDYSLHVNSATMIRFNFSTSLFNLSIPVNQMVSLNPYADLAMSNEDAARVLAGEFGRYSGNRNNFPRVMFRLEAEPRFTLDEQSIIGLFISCYYTPMSKRRLEDGLRGDGRGDGLSFDSAFFPLNDVEGDMLLMGYSVPFLGFSFKVSFSAVF